jgi:predicted Fe-S protein YdhL (DUF1289 family)
MHSPCIKLCIHDPVAGLCQGCGRTLAEIQDWIELSEAEQLRIMAELPQRLRKHRPGKV